MKTKPLVLIIDDILENVRLLSYTLSSSYRIQFANSGEEALNLLTKIRPDLILLDVMMPGMNGYEVFSRLKSEPATESIPVIFVTAKSDAESESEALNAGAVDFIHKPINADVARARVKLQLELAQHRNYLEKMVIKRTEELSVALAEAESANAVKTRFMTNVSHEMRTPLQGILGFAEIGQRRAAKSEQQNLATYFEHIMDSGLRMHTLVESLLTLTNEAWNEHAGMNGGLLKEINLQDFLLEISTLLGLHAEKRQQSLLLEVNATGKSLVGDPVRLRQLMEHLLRNAFNYSQKDACVTLRVSDTQLDSNVYLKTVPAISFQIIDQGCGVPEAEINAIFEPFYQSTRTASGAGGTGLGLPLSRCIVERHGGTISLANRPEGGVIAEVTLPVEQLQAA